MDIKNKEYCDEQIAAHILDNGDIKKMRERQKQEKEEYKKALKKFGHKKLKRMEKEAISNIEMEKILNSV